MRRLLTLEPALVRGVITALVALGLVWGLDFTDLGEQLKETADIVGGLVSLISAWWIRGSVYPATRVAEAVDPDGTRIAGPASPLSTGTPIRR